MESTSSERPSTEAMEMQKAQALQNRLYFILDKLQLMACELPAKYQQRISNDLLSGLANTLLHDTIFEIVQGLKEIQDVTEKQLFQSRVQLMERHRLDRHILSERKKDSVSYDKELESLKKGQQKEVKMFDMRIVLQMDQKVSDQQVMLEKAGVPGFYVTNNPAEIRVQMHLLEFILKLSSMAVPHVSLD